MRSTAPSRTAAATSARPSCHFCGGKSTAWLEVPGDWRAPHARRAYRLRRCAACDVGFVDPMPAYEDVRSAYAGGHLAHTRDAFPRVDRSRLVDRVLVAMAQTVDRGADIDAAWMQRRFGRGRLRICDVGCGNGALLQRIAPLGHALSGLEIDPRATRRAQGLGLHVLEGAIEEMPTALASQRFDVVFCMHVLEHCVDPDLALARTAALLAPSGTLVLEVPNSAARGLAFSGAAWPFLDVPRHLHFFTTRSLTRAVERAGLEVLEVEYVGYHRQFSTAWLEREQTIWDGLLEHAGSPDALPPRSSRRRARSLLLSTLLGPPDQTHDSVRALCRAPSARAIRAREATRAAASPSAPPECS